MANERVAFYMLHPRRSKEAFTALIDAWEGILVSDGYGVYQGWAPARQTCLAHLIRSARGLAARDHIVAQVDQWPVELRRARHQLLTREPREDEWSDAMRHTPRQRHYAYALRGFWPCFPVSPASYAERLASQFTTRSWFSEKQSFGLARKLVTFLHEVASLIVHDEY